MEGEEDVIDYERLHLNFKMQSMKYCSCLYYWNKTGVHPFNSEISEEDLMDFHYFGLQFDNRRQNLFWKTMGKMLGGKK